MSFEAVQDLLDGSGFEGAFEIEEENVLAEFFSRGTGFNFGKVDFGVGEFFEDREKATWFIFVKVESDGGFLAFFKTLPPKYNESGLVGAVVFDMASEDFEFAMTGCFG